MPEIDFDSLKSVPAHPLPATEVRRLGDRRRTRRRTVLAVATTAAAVAAVAVLGATLAGGHGDHAVQPITGPSSTPPAPPVVVVHPSPTTRASSSHVTSTNPVQASPSTIVADDGSAGAGAWSTDLLPTASDLIEPGETTTPWQAGEIRSGVPASWLTPCRADAGEAPVQPGYVAAAWRDFTPLRDVMGADAKAQAALLDYPTQSAAQAAYQDLSDAYANCPAVIRADGRQVVTSPAPADVDLGAFSSGPNAAEARTFMLGYANDAAHAVTEVQHGIAVDGSHLLVLTINLTTQDDWRDLQMSMPAVMERFGNTTGLPRTLMFPNQIDYVRLGESYDEAMAGGDLVQVATGGNESWALRPYGNAGGDTGTIPGSVCVTPKYGVEAIWMPAQVTTAEGIGTGSTEAEVRQAYPDVKDEGNGYLDHRLWGGSDPQEYHFGIQDGKVVEWAVMSADQHCFQ